MPGTAAARTGAFRLSDLRPDTRPEAVVEKGVSDVQESR
jgi:hypothetical protein